jgi:FHA domain-containing protein
MGWSMWLMEAHLPFHIGRHSDNDLRNSSNCVSRKHCMLDLRDDELCIIDTGSLNGTALHNQIIKNEEVNLSEKTCVLLSDMMMWITPCDDNGKLIKDNTAANTLPNYDGKIESRHGVCLVDICDSMEIELEQVNHISQMLRTTIVGHEHEKLLMLKHMGDGYLAVFDSCLPTVTAAKRLLSWQSSDENVFSANIRITMDAGVTHRSHGHDRSGLPICRAARIEKTQIRDIEAPGKDVKKLKSRNRCVMTKSMSEVLDTTVSERYTFIGKRKLKGFANELHSIYQYNS